MGDSEIPSFSKIHVPKIRNLKDYGMKLEAKVFYEDVDDDGRNRKWVEYIPASLPAPTRRRFDSAAIQVFMRNDDEMVLNNVANFKTSFIKVQSPILLEQLKQLLEPDEIRLSKEFAEIHHPFQPLYFIWDELRNRRAKADLDTRQHLDVLLKFMDESLGETKKTFEELQSQGWITYDLIWALFPRGTYVFSTKFGYGQAFKVLAAGVSSNGMFGMRVDNWTVRCEYVQFDGYEYGFSEASFTLPHFHGKKTITSLDIVPWPHLPNQASLKNHFIERARTALNYQSVHYLCYKGIGLLPLADNIKINASKFNIDGRIVIDSYLYARTNEKLRRSIRSLRFQKAEKGSEQSGRDLLDDRNVWEAREVREVREVWEAREAREAQEDQRSALVSRPRPDEHQQKHNREQLVQDDEKLWIMSPILDGFSLNDKVWMNFLVESIKPLKLDDSAYDNLVLDEEYKELILSFAKLQQSKVNEMSDIVSGKGEGLLVLLSGPPGTGKTLTAEAVADRVGRPVYHVDTHELGTDLGRPVYYSEAPMLGAEAGGLSSRLRSIMNTAAEWNAIVLLDEADVFLQSRNPDNPTRNEHVATFLRELEYYRGTLFLTTNLYDTIDEAVESRVQLHIVFRKLDIAARVKVWTNFLRWNGSYESSVSAEDVEELSKWSLNGRQIKNALSMTTKYCSISGDPINLKDIEKTIRLTNPRAVKDNESTI